MSNEQYYASYGITSEGTDLPVLLWLKKPKYKDVSLAYKERVGEVFIHTTTKAEIIYDK